MTYAISEKFIRSLDDSLLTKKTIESRRIWDSLPIDLAKYFSNLDKDVTEDEFFHALGWTAPYDKLKANKIDYVGDLIAFSETELAQQTGLTFDELQRLAAALSGLGLQLGSDNQRWREYRMTVPPEFRLRPPYGRRLPNVVRSPRLT